MESVPKIWNFIWYKQEQYVEFRSACIDGHVLPPTYDEWLEKALNAVDELERKGVTVIKAEVDIDDFRAWCAFNGHKLDAKGRVAFANIKATEYWRRKLGHQDQ